jgi:hypothetical protein
MIAVLFLPVILVMLAFRSLALMTRPRRRQAGEGGISSYATKAGVRYWAKYRVPLDDDGTMTKEVLKRGFQTRKAAAAFLTDKRAEIKKGVHVAPSKITVASGSISGSTVCDWRRQQWRRTAKMFGCTSDPSWALCRW